MTLHEAGLVRTEPLSEAQIAGLRVEAEELVLALRLRDVELACHRREDRAQRLARGLRLDHAPRNDEELARALGDDGGARSAATEQVGERACEVSRQVEGPRALHAVVEREVFAEHPALHERHVRRRVTRAEKGLPSAKAAYSEMALEQPEVAVVERGEAAEPRAPPSQVFATCLRLRRST